MRPPNPLFGDAGVGVKAALDSFYDPAIESHDLVATTCGGNAKEVVDEREPFCADRTCRRRHDRTSRTSFASTSNIMPGSSGPILEGGLQRWCPICGPQHARIYV
jgi:hypothetical protein